MTTSNNFVSDTSLHAIHPLLQLPEPVPLKIEWPPVTQANPVRPYISDPAIMKMILLDGSTRTLLNSPKGSGKNHFALTEIPKLGRTLVITIRIMIDRQSRAFVRRQIKECRTSHRPHTLSDAKPEHQLVIATQWEWEELLAKGQEFLASFDYIIIDEVHFLRTDAFNEAAYWMEQIIASIPSEVKVIAMSANTEVVDDLPLFKSWRRLDLNGLVREVRPSTVSTISSYERMAILKQTNENWRAFVVMQTRYRAHRLVEVLNEAGIPAIEVLGIEEGEKRPPDQQAALDHLIEHETLPPGIFVLVSTSKLAVGTNINDETVKIVISELIDSISLNQVPGRIRHKAGFDYVVVTNLKDINLVEDQKVDVALARKFIRHREEEITRAKEDFMSRDEFESMWPSKVPEGFGSVIIKDDLHWRENQLWTSYLIARQEFAERFEANPAICLEEIFQMEVTTYKSMTARRILATWVDRSIDKVTRDQIRKQFTDAGIDGKSLKPMLEGTGFSINQTNRSQYVIAKTADDSQGQMVAGLHGIALS